MQTWLLHHRESSDRWEEPPDEPPGDYRQVSGLRRLGMIIFLISLAALFIPLLIVLVIIRVTTEQWPPRGLPPLPSNLLLSTVLLLGVSGAMEGALREVRRDRARRARRAVWLGLALAAGFVLSQVYAWGRFLGHDIPLESWRIAGYFYVFTGLHALHVIGGVAPLVIVAFNCLRGHYTPLRHEGLRHCAMYWHFLDGVWLVILAALLVVFG